MATERSVDTFPVLAATFDYPMVIPVFELAQVARILHGFDQLAQWAYRGVEGLPISSRMYTDEEGKYYSIPADHRGIIVVRRVHCESPLEVIIQIGGIVGGFSAMFYVVAARLLAVYRKFKEARSFGAQQDTIRQQELLRQAALKVIMEEFQPNTVTVTEREALHDATLALLLMQKLEELE